tara:strand:+ start:2944 stop:3249 length:306 start_codon:yes stop_codon:yes gene_type:complete
MEWGLRDVKFLSPFSFSANKQGKTYTFGVLITDYNDNMDVVLPVSHEQYLIVCIANKKGDNCVLLDGGLCRSPKVVSMKWIGQNLKRKFYVRFTSDILHDG